MAQIIKREPEGKFWADGFDLDLYKVIPDSRKILEEFGGTILHTRGHHANGRLNHPTCWNHDSGMISFFSFNGEAIPEGYYSSSDPIVECTFEEAIRDAWVHMLHVTVAGQSIWNAFAIHEQFQTLLYHHRGWKLDEEAAAAARHVVGDTLVDAVLKFEELVKKWVVRVAPPDT